MIKILNKLAELAQISGFPQLIFSAAYILPQLVFIPSHPRILRRAGWLTGSGTELIKILNKLAELAPIS